MRVVPPRVLSSFFIFCFLFVGIEQTIFAQISEINQKQANFNVAPRVVSSNTVMLFATTDAGIEHKLKANYDTFHPERLESILAPVTKEFQTQDNIDL